MTSVKKGCKEYTYNPLLMSLTNDGKILDNQK